MEAEAARYIAKGLIALAMLGTAVGEGYIVGKAMEAIGRNPETTNNIFPKMIIGVAMAESTAIYAMVLFFVV
ncbi:MAG: ATP synthase F0 subunit C [Candidatus Harrisonbacteria bacterium CG10_big_fil_rev_8_21_14_0_10_49_15]|uniref:ATP synthase subunit c n=1 Tax=Candidatus Harrisonbacteria bacterium CG10_big_fil_rev_8_21_14_0_10_49_15 TaxID=1974587 RepID=A0A2H0UMH8_9BACT|nr:MAG: ATP synthase F0 subunit C [Candidatus Harrisonbacteria bacterium CG10_big_fil_rev_8_21_14_0_10_49_15]